MTIETEMAKETTSLIDKNNKGQRQTPSLLVSVRFLLVFLIFLVAAIQCMQKISMGIGIVCMVNTTTSNIPNFENQTTPNDDMCLFKLNKTQPSTLGEFDWSKKSQSFVLSSYFYGYLLTAKIPGGWLSMKFGGKKVLGFSMLTGSILTMLVPLISRYSFPLLLICRFFTGLAHGMVWPAANDIFIRWVPVAEKSRLIGFSSAGAKIGNIIALPLGSYLCVNGFDSGWPSIFYIYGFIGIIWFILFMCLTSNSPSTHKFITRNESDYLFDTTILRNNRRNIDIQSANKKRRVFNDFKTPWIKILTSKPCIAIYCVQFSSNWGILLLLTQLPTFMNEILKFDIEANGLFSALPYVSGWVCAIVSSQISDFLIKSQLLSRNKVRKIFSGFSLLVPMVATLFLAFVDCSDPYLAVILLSICVGFLGLSIGAGYVININEVGGVYSGILFGFSNTFGTIPGILAPYVVDILTPNKLQSEWRIVFIITAVIYFIGGVVFILLSEAEPQSWAIEGSTEEEE